MTTLFENQTHDRDTGASAGRVGKAGKDPNRCPLAGAVRSEKAEDASGGHRQVETVECAHAAVVLGQSFDPDRVQAIHLGSNTPVELLKLPVHLVADHQRSRAGAMGLRISY